MGLEKMLGDVVNFHGIGWPLARVIDVSQIELKLLAPTPGLRPGAVAGRNFTLAVDDERGVLVGREWHTNRPQALWRSFGELVLPDNEPDFGEGVLAFVKRYGAFDRTIHGRIETGPWLGFMHYLADIGQAWDAPDADGVSRLTHDTERLAQAKTLLTSFLLPAAMADSVLVTHGPIVPIRFNSHADGLSPQIQARSLRSYLTLSAASMFRRRAAMRHCNHCSVWFEPPRRDALYCSSYCRGAHHTEKAQ